MNHAVRHFTKSAYRESLKAGTLAISSDASPTSFKSLLRRAVFLPIAMSLSLLFILSFEIFELRRVTHLALHKEAITGKIYELRLLLMELQSGMRGFLLTGDEWFLNPFRIYLGRIDRLLTEDSGMRRVNQVS